MAYPRWRPSLREERGGRRWGTATRHTAVDAMVTLPGRGGVRGLTAVAFLAGGPRVPRRGSPGGRPRGRPACGGGRGRERRAERRFPLPPVFSPRRRGPPRTLRSVGEGRSLAARRRSYRCDVAVSTPTLLPPALLKKSGSVTHAAGASDLKDDAIRSCFLVGQAMLRPPLDGTKSRGRRRRRRRRRRKSTDGGLPFAALLAFFAAAIVT